MYIQMQFFFLFYIPLLKGLGFLMGHFQKN